jgi:pyruvate dehydrogenase E2 component (dihydrolipoamide acetyltransferase)
MPREVKLPKLGENVEGGKVLAVKVTPGSTVSKGQPLVEVEAEKATVELPAPEAGKVTQVLVNAGDEVTAGQTICVIEGGPQPVAAAEPVEPAQPPPQPPPAPAETAKPAAPSPPAPPRQPAPPAPAGDGSVPAGPATRRLARELGVNLRQVQGTGPHGRVTPDDVKGYVKRLASVPSPAAGAPALPDFAQWGPVDVRPLETVRRRTAEHLSLAWTQIPHVTQHDQCDITDLDAFRRQQEKGEPGVSRGEPGASATGARHGEPGASATGVKLTVTAFAVKAAVIALREFPQFNSSIDLANGRLILKRYYHIGIAVDTDRGLLVPVLRNADQQSVYGLAQQLTAIAQKAREKKLSPDEMRGGTFTITNLGGIGGTAFTPIVNYPEVAILGISRARLQPVVRDGQIVPRLVMTLSLSYDHRVIDGADGARFLRRVCDMLENPLKMLLHA